MLVSFLLHHYESSASLSYLTGQSLVLVFDIHLTYFLPLLLSIYIFTISAMVALKRIFRVSHSIPTFQLIRESIIEIGLHELLSH